MECWFTLDPFISITMSEFISISFHLTYFLTKDAPDPVSCLAQQLKQQLLLSPSNSEPLSLFHRNFGAYIP